MQFQATARLVTLTLVVASGFALAAGDRIRSRVPFASADKHPCDPDIVLEHARLDDLTWKQD